MAWQMIWIQIAYTTFPVISFKENYRYFLQVSIIHILIKFAEHLKIPLLMALIEPQLTFVGIFLTNVLWDYFFVARKYLNTESPRIMRFQFCVVHISFWKFKNGFSIGMYVPWLHFLKKIQKRAWSLTVQSMVHLA